MTTTDLTGTTAIVTGASRGFGRGIAGSLAGAGAHVVGVARGEADLLAVHDQLGGSFTPVVADAADPELAGKLLAEHHPTFVVLNAGTTPPPAPVQDQTWETFSTTWDVDVQHVFHFVRAALRSPLDPGSVVVSFSSGAALRGSPLSGGYAGSKAAIRFLSAYAAGQSDQLDLGIRFVAALPQLTPATELGATYVDAYADLAGLTREQYLAGFDDLLTPTHVGDAILDLVSDDTRTALAYLMTPGGAAPVDG